MTVEHLFSFVRIPITVSPIRFVVHFRDPHIIRDDDRQTKANVLTVNYTNFYPRQRSQSFLQKPARVSVSHLNHRGNLQASSDRKRSARPLSV